MAMHSQGLCPIDQRLVGQPLGMKKLLGVKLTQSQPRLPLHTKYAGEGRRF